MDLWIRSQDRTKLIKANEINVYQYDESAGLGNDWHIFVRDYEVGVYKSKERALEVLDTIQNILQPIINYQPIVREKFDEKTMLLPYIEHEQVGSKTEIIQFSTYVYEMPKE